MVHLWDKPGRKWALRIALPYLIIGLAWILFSDQILASLVTDPHTLIEIQMLKGWFFVLMSSLFIYAVAFHQITRLTTVTECLNASESALRETERSALTFMSSLPGMAYRRYNDSAQSMIFVSAGAYELSGYHPEDLIGEAGTSWRDLIRTEDVDRVQREVEAAVNGGKPYRCMYRIRQKSGRETWVFDQGYVVSVNGIREEVLEGFVTDINDRIEAEKRARQADRLQSVGRAAASIVHDFKNPLQVIMTSAEFAGLDGMDPTSRQRYVNKIIEQVSAMQTMSIEILEFSRGEIVLHRTPVDVAAECRKIVETFAPVAAQGGITAVFQNQEPGVNKGITCLIDVPRFTRALVNILTNAVEATPRGGSVHVHFAEVAGQIELEIRDTGSGIPEALRKSVFDPFVSGGKIGGTGLGLAITKSIIEAHGGSVSFTTDNLTGTAFFVRIPLSSVAGTDSDNSSDQPVLKRAESTH